MIEVSYSTFCWPYESSEAQARDSHCAEPKGNQTKAQIIINFLFLSALHLNKASEQVGELSVLETDCGLFGDRKEFKIRRILQNYTEDICYFLSTQRTPARSEAPHVERTARISSKFWEFLLKYVKACWLLLKSCRIIREFSSVTRDVWLTGHRYGVCTETVQTLNDMNIQTSVIESQIVAKTREKL